MRPADGHRAARDVRAVHALAHHQQVGDEAPVVAREHRPRAPEPGHHLVDDQQHAVRVADLAHQRPVALRRREVAADAEQRLRQERRHRAGRLRLDRGGEGVGSGARVGAVAERIRRRDVDVPGHDRGQSRHPAHRHAGRAHRARGVAVVAPQAADHRRAGRVDLRPVQPHQRERLLDRLRAARRERDAVEIAGQQRREPRGRGHGLRVREPVEQRHVRQLLDLGLDRLDQPAVPVAEVDAVELRPRVEVPAAVDVVEEHALAAFEHDVGRIAHGQVRVHQVAPVERQDVVAQHAAVTSSNSSRTRSEKASSFTCASLST